MWWKWAKNVWKKVEMGETGSASKNATSPMHQNLLPNNNDAQSTTKYGLLLRPNAQIVALRLKRVHCPLQTMHHIPPATILSVVSLICPYTPEPPRSPKPTILLSLNLNSAPTFFPSGPRAPPRTFLGKTPSFGTLCLNIPPSNGTPLPLHHAKCFPDCVKHKSRKSTMPKHVFVVL